MFFVLQRDRIMNKICRLSLIVSDFNYHFTFVLLAFRTIKEVIKQNKEVFDNNIIIKHEYLVY